MGFEKFKKPKKKKEVARIIFLASVHHTPRQGENGAHGGICEGARGMNSTRTGKANFSPG